MDAHAALELLARLARGVGLAAGLTGFGTLVLAALLSGPAAAGPERVWTSLRRLARAALTVAILAMVSWLLLHARLLTDAERGWWAAARLVAGGTTFGRALLAQAGLLALAQATMGTLRSQPRVLLAAGLAAGALGLQPRLGHAAASDVPFLPLLVALHVIAAGLWLGALPGLLIAVARSPVTAARVAVRRFSWLGLAAVGVVAVTAVLQSLPLVGDIGGLFGTLYGRVALAKTLGFAGLLALAALNRFVLTPAMTRNGSGPLVTSIAVELVLGASVLVGAVALASLPPGAHEQAVWPFPLQPDLSRIDEPYFAKELWRAAAFLSAGLAGLAGLLWRRTRLIGPAGALVALVWLPNPNLALLAKPAWPTSFQRSETGFTAASILRGEKILRRHCTAACFRPRDDPSDPTPYGLWQRADGDLYGWLTTTFDPIGHTPFPHGTIARLEPRERWQLIDYFRARVAGSAARLNETWAHPVLLPGFPVRCRDGGTLLRGRPDRAGPVEITVALGGATPSPEAAPPGVPLTRVLLAARETDAVPSGFDCMSGSPDAVSALALMSGCDEDQLDGTRLLVDANGWLRVRIPPRRSGASVPASPVRDAELVRIAAEPFDAGDVGTHRH
ncbi:hypothetical protein OPKNFCMD_2192 [Methylobacterium crusticola]|uniref:Copper resistance protein D domain-containing protein n=1 Tax=Methylobacterium crusticola TaxID=1697972 RepID=A0ABQ4QY15_9HYPH|nr:CopD family protein [Methylobacterium crusticola]GJD49462.1 hypothetical protein OPKNFCMD_2192 [Methylobacterium crusticola]